MNTSNEILEQEAPVKNPQPPKTPKPTPRTRPARQEEPVEAITPPHVFNNDIELDISMLQEIEWIETSSNNRQIELPLQLMVYYKVGENNKKAGRITFSYFLTDKYGKDKKFKFGAFKGKILFQVTDNDGLNSQLSKTKYSKLCISNIIIIETIIEKYNIQQSLQSKPQSTYFKLKDLGNDFYLIDEIIK